MMSFTYFSQKKIVHFFAIEPTCGYIFIVHEGSALHSNRLVTHSSTYFNMRIFIWDVTLTMYCIIFCLILQKNNHKGSVNKHVCSKLVGAVMHKVFVGFHRLSFWEKSAIILLHEKIWFGLQSVFQHLSQ